MRIRVFLVQLSERRHRAAGPRREPCCHVRRVRRHLGAVESETVVRQACRLARVRHLDDLLQDDTIEVRLRGAFPVALRAAALA